MTSQNLSKLVVLSVKLLDDKQAAEYLSVSPGTLSVWRSTGRYALKFIKVGRAVRYRMTDLDEWLEARVRANGATF
jgi:excisionase family DNA binding protein